MFQKKSKLGKRKFEKLLFLKKINENTRKVKLDELKKALIFIKKIL